MAYRFISPVQCFLFLLFILFFYSSAAHAVLNRCPRHQVSTDLKSKLVKTKVYRGSTREFTEYVQGHSRGDSRILGFVNQAEIYTRLQYKFSIKDIGHGRYCVMLDKVRGYFYAAPKLFMPKDYSKSSCEYKEVLKHEKRHLQAVYDFHDHNTGKYAAYLGRIARDVPIHRPIRTEAEAQQVRQRIRGYFERNFRELEQKSLIQLNKIQRKIDSPQEYIGVSKRCDNW